MIPMPTGQALTLADLLDTTQKAMMRGHLGSLCKSDIPERCPSG